jgi:hypothetical protein
MEGLGVAVRRARRGGAARANAQQVPRLERELLMMLSEEFQE